MSSTHSSKDLSSWVEKYTNDLLAYTLTKVSDLEIAQDIVQETFVAAVKALPNFKGNSAPKTWLIGILKRKVADYYRKKNRDMTSNNVEVESIERSETYFLDNGSWQAGMNEWTPDLHLLDDKSFNLVFKDCMNNLPENWNYAIRQKFLEGTSSAEICKVLDITPTNYWQIIRRAKLHVKGCLEQKWFKENK